MVLNTDNTPRGFDMVTGDKVVPLMVRRLSVKQLKRVGDIMDERVRDIRRQEFMATAKLLPEADRTRFLIDAARGNHAVDTSEAQNVADSEYGMLQVLMQASDSTEAELKVLLDTQVNFEQLDLARYHALGLDVDELMKAVTAAKETKTQAPFPDKLG